MNAFNPLRYACLVLLVVLSAAGCATSGQTFTQARSGLPPPAADKGRIFIYRTAVIGFAVQPPIMVNGHSVGASVPLGFYVVDQSPGDVQIVTATEVARSVSFTLEPGQTRYVRLNIGMGFFVGHVWPELVEESVGLQEIANCHLLNGTSDRLALGSL